MQLIHKFGHWNAYLANDLIPFLHLDGAVAADLISAKKQELKQQNIQM